MKEDKGLAETISNGESGNPYVEIETAKAKDEHGATVPSNRYVN